MKDRKSFALCVRMGAQSDFEYLNDSAITTPNTKIVAAVTLLKTMQSQPSGKVDGDEQRRRDQRSDPEAHAFAELLQHEPPIGNFLDETMRSDVPSTLFQVTRSIDGCGGPNRAMDPKRLTAVSSADTARARRPIGLSLR